MCRLAAAHNTHRLMLLGLPPDMVHGVLLHRAHTSIFRNFYLESGTSSHCSLDIIAHSGSFVKDYMIIKKNFQKKAASGYKPVFLSVP